MIHNRVYGVISRILAIPVEQIKDELSSSDVELWDSLKHMNLILALEEEFQIQFEYDHIAEMNDVSSLVEKVQQQVEG